MKRSTISAPKKTPAGGGFPRGWTWPSLALAALLAGVPAPGRADTGLPALERYAGSEACGKCHPEKHEGWQASLHYSVVQDPRKDPGAVLGDFSSPEVDFSVDDVVFTIGGHWYQRYAVEIGAERYVLPKVWSVANQRWETQDAWSWKKKPYDRYCIGCHSTRFDPDDGRFVEHRVGCEACHGPGGSHARTGGTATISNPGNWSRDERDLLCASCHVRGFDPTGTYPFPTGYIPGGDLTEHYVPLRRPDGVSSRQAFLTTFRLWLARVGEGPPPGCDVCGIDRPPSAPSTPAATVTDRCLGCHRFGEDYDAHTRHPGRLELQCLDCHREIRPSGSVASTPDVHTPEFFQVHDRADPSQGTLEDACLSCHRDMPREQLGKNLRTWRRPQHWLSG